MRSCIAWVGGVIQSAIAIASLFFILVFSNFCMDESIEEAGAGDDGDSVFICFIDLEGVRLGYADFVRISRGLSLVGTTVNLLVDAKPDFSETEINGVGIIEGISPEKWAERDTASGSQNIFFAVSKKSFTDPLELVKGLNFKIPEPCILYVYHNIPLALSEAPRKEEETPDSMITHLFPLDQVQAAQMSAKGIETVLINNTFHKKVETAFQSINFRPHLAPDTDEQAPDIVECRFAVPGVTGYFTEILYTKVPRFEIRKKKVAVRKLQKSK